MSFSFFISRSLSRSLKKTKHSYGLRIGSHGRDVDPNRLERGALGLDVTSDGLDQDQDGLLFGGGGGGGGGGRKKKKKGEKM